MAWRGLLCVVFLASLSACATPAPIVKTVEVRVPTPVSCVPKLGPRPDFAAMETRIDQADNLIDLAKIYRSGWVLKDAWIAEVEAALSGCAGG